MNYQHYQRSLSSLAFGAQDDDDDDHALPGFALYRTMIRERIFAMARVAYRQSWALLGEDACTAALARCLGEQPPTSPFIREVIATYGERLARDRELLAHAPPWTPDLLRFERTKWCVASLPSTAAAGALRDVDFAGLLVLNPTLELLPLRYSVADGAEARTPLPHTLLVYRRADEADVRWYRCERLLAAVLVAARDHGGNLARLVPQALASLGEPPNEGALQAFSEALATAVGRGVVLGVRD